MADMLTMRQEAVRRAKEMHMRAHPSPNISPQESTEPTPPVHTSPSNNNNLINNLNLPFNTDILSTFFKDKDKTIILALLILLSGEDGDNSMLLALMYLLI